MLRSNSLNDWLCPLTDVFTVCQIFTYGLDCVDYYCRPARKCSTLSLSLTTSISFVAPIVICQRLVHTTGLKGLMKPYTYLRLFYRQIEREVDQQSGDLTYLLLHVTPPPLTGS